jgi:hypothetical protein
VPRRAPSSAGWARDAVIETVRELADALSAESVSVDELVERIGGRGTAAGDSIVIEAPALDGVERAGVVRHVHDGPPALVTLHLSRPQPREELEAAFGAPRSIHPDHIGEPVTLLFELDLPDRPFDVALLATDDQGGSRTLTLRRDVRLG